MILLQEFKNKRTEVSINANSCLEIAKYMDIFDHTDVGVGGSERKCMRLEAFTAEQ